MNTLLCLVLVSQVTVGEEPEWFEKLERLGAGHIAVATQSIGSATWTTFTKPLTVRSTPFEINDYREGSDSGNIYRIRAFGWGAVLDGSGLWRDLCAVCQEVYVLRYGKYVLEARIWAVNFHWDQDNRLQASWPEFTIPVPYDCWCEYERHEEETEE